MKENLQNTIKTEQVYVGEQLPLLTADGSLTKAGYSTKDVWRYNKQNIANKGKLKEWEFYQISNEKWLLQITYGHVSYAGNVNFTLLEFDTNKRFNCGVMKFFPGNSFALNFTGGQAHNVAYDSEKISIKFEKTPTKRNLWAKTADTSCFSEVFLSMSEKGDAMCYVMPFKDKLFYYNFKRFFTDLTGSIVVNGKTYEIDDKTHCLIDSGRGCWPYRHTWLWGMAQGNVDGQTFAFDLGYGNSDRGDTTENMFFVDGVAHKLGKLTVQYDNKDYLRPWKFSTDDNVFNATFTPFYDNFTETNFIVVHNRCHQVFGHYSGTATLSCGKQIIFSNLNGFCEIAKNRW